MTYTTILFDLDGTLIDPFVGITRSIQYALERMSAPVPDGSALRWCIGPPLWDSFEVLLNTSDRGELDRAVAFYRERFTVDGLYENTLIEGIDALISSLSTAGCKLFVATSKPHAYAGKIVEHFGLMPYFIKVYGSELDGTRSAKADLIAYLLQQEGLSAKSCVMVGDRKHDLIGAHANEVASVGVTWGYGSSDELEREKPAAIFGHPVDLGQWLTQA